MSEPLVSAIMVTGKDPARRDLAIAAIHSFVKQTYANKELIIVNDGSPFRDWPGLPPIDGELAMRIRVHDLAYTALSLGALRNIGLEQAQGDFIVQFDDDDWHHEDRIASQLAAALEHKCAVTLVRQIRYSFLTNSAYTHNQYPKPSYKVGIPGTILHPKTDLRYPDERVHEDTHFAQLFPRLHIMHNKPELYIRFAHGNNTWSQRHIMGYNTTRDKWQLSLGPADYLGGVLKKHYDDRLTVARGLRAVQQ